MKHDKINTLSLTDFKIDFCFMIKYFILLENRHTTT